MHSHLTPAVPSEDSTTPLPCPHVPGAACADRAECAGDSGCVRKWPRADRPSSPAVEKAMDRFYAAGPSRDALENCRLFAARHRKEEWAKTILRFCAEGGATGTPLRKYTPALATRQPARIALLLNRLVLLVSAKATQEPGLPPDERITDAEVDALEAEILELTRAARPAAWVRRHPDGTLTGELLLDSRIEQVRKDSGAWVPLVPAGVRADGAVEAGTEQHGSHEMNPAPSPLPSIPGLIKP
jgi:hypothetical protein